MGKVSSSGGSSSKGNALPDGGSSPDLVATGLKGGMVDSTAGDGTVDLTCDGDSTLEPVAERVDDEGFDMEACCNFGSPIKVEWDGKTHEFVDGFGMCSPTRWPPQARGHGRKVPMKELAAATFRCLQLAATEAIKDVRRDAFKLVTGKIRAKLPPFRMSCCTRSEHRLQRS